MTTRTKNKPKTAPKKKPLDIHVKKGAMTEYIKKNYGNDGFDKNGRIKESVLDNIRSGKPAPKTGAVPNQHTKSRATFAKNARHWNHKKT